MSPSEQQGLQHSLRNSGPQIPACLCSILRAVCPPSIDRERFNGVTPQIPPPPFLPHVWGKRRINPPVTVCPAQDSLPGHLFLPDILPHQRALWNYMTSGTLQKAHVRPCRAASLRCLMDVGREPRMNGCSHSPGHSFLSCFLCGSLGQPYPGIFRCLHSFLQLTGHPLTPLSTESPADPAILTAGEHQCLCPDTHLCRNPRTEKNHRAVTYTQEIHSNSFLLSKVWRSVAL
ncbi:hypothetical protein JZ751_001339 [Albula glossodonta]|uniref:Uncharacterized protein n=1 Tax=Albula glossodonta TaxID=121402 RepID=A0A8T2PTL5_9TELE|nr:hypothetical protein JZ751_001339 [Albula glossodonta]